MPHNTVSIVLSYNGKYIIKDEYGNELTGLLDMNEAFAEMLKHI